MSTTSMDPVSWPFLPKPINGSLAYPTLAQSVTDSIRIILTTLPGEQLMRPRFGAGLQNFLDEGNTISLRRTIQSAIVTNLQKYENRIAIDAVNVDPVSGAPAEVQVTIYYRLLRTNTSQQIGARVKVG